MALNASIFGNMLNAPKSPEEYLAERQNLQASKLANALNQQKADEYTKGIARQGELRNLLAGGADAGALRLAGFLGEAADWDKNAALVAKDKAAAAKDTNDANLKTWQAYRDQSSMIRNPQEAVAWITRGYNDPIIGPFLQRFGSLEEGVSRIPQDPAGFEQWRMGVGSNVDKMAEHAMKQQEFGETVRHNKSTEGIQERNNIRSNERMIGNGRGGVGGDAPSGGVSAKPSKPLPVGALKMQQDSLDAIGTAGGINADLGAVLQQIESGALQLGPVKNAVGSVRNTLGVSNENSQNLATFKATLEKLRNDSLRLNKGVQTDGDAQRAWNELLSNINDLGVVAKRLKDIISINSRAIELHNDNLGNIRSNYGAQPIDTTKRATQKPAIESAVKRINSDDEYNALPSGATFIAPDGKTRRKP